MDTLTKCYGHLLKGRMLWMVFAAFLVYLFCAGGYTAPMRFIAFAFFLTISVWVVVTVVERFTKFAPKARVFVVTIIWWCMAVVWTWQNATYGYVVAITLMSIPISALWWGVWRQRHWAQQIAYIMYFAIFGAGAFALILWPMWSPENWEIITERYLQYSAYYAWAFCSLICIRLDKRDWAANRNTAGDNQSGSAASADVPSV